MMQNVSGNAMPDNAHGRRASSESYSYSYSASEGHPDDGAAERANTGAAHAEGGETPSQQRQQQFSPVSAIGPDAAAASGKNSRKLKAAKGKAKAAKKDQMELENGADGNGEGGKRRRGPTLPGAARVHAMVALAATTASADTQRITIYLFFVFSSVNMLFVVLSCVLSQLDTSGGGCYTFWGFKVDCDATSYTIRSSLLWNTQMKQNLQAGAAMSILAVLSAVGVFVMSWMLVIRARVSLANQTKQKRYAALHGEGVDDIENGDSVDGEGRRGSEKTASYIQTGMLKWAAVALMLANLVFGLIAWAIIAGLFSARPGEDRNEPRGMTYGVGFGLGITAWIAELIMLVILAILV